MNDIKKLNKKKCVVSSLVIVFLLIILFIFSLGESYNELSVMLNNDIIELKNKPIIDENDNIFFSREDVLNLFDNTIYYNEAEELLITTYNKHIAKLNVGSSEAEINDEKVNLKGVLKIDNNIVYIPISDLAEVYDLEMYYSHQSNRIIIDSINKEKKEVVVKERTKLKKRKGLFSKKIETLIIGQKLFLMDSSGSYKKVRSELGNIGYVKVNKVSEEKQIRENVEYEKIDIVPYFNYSNSSGIYDNIEVDKSKRNVVLPEFFYVEKECRLLDKTNLNTATYSVYKKWVEDNGLEILPTLANNVNVSDSLLSYENRSKIITELQKKVSEYGFWGININFKTIDDFNTYYRFIIELVPRFRQADLKVIITINDNNIERNRIDKIVDCIVEE